MKNIPKLLFSVLITALVIVSWGKAETGSSLRQVIEVDSSLVVVDVKVLNRKDQKPIPDLKHEDFLVYEDGVLQKIVSFSKDVLPMSIVLLVDTTWSLHPVLNRLSESAQKILYGLKPQDEVAVIAFAGTALLVQSFTLEREVVAREIEHITKNRIEVERTIGTSAQLNEGVYQAVQYASKDAKSGNRKIIVVLNDGLANICRPNSHTEKETLAAIFESGISIYGVEVRSLRSNLFGFINKVHPAMIALSRLHPPGSVAKYATQTGGAVVKSSDANADLRMADLILGLRECYTLSYSPSNSKLDGKFRSIKVIMGPDARKRNGNTPIILSRRGYYAVPHKM